MLIVRVIGIPDKTYPRDIWGRLLKQFKPLRSERVLKQRNSRRIPTRSAQTCNKTKLLRISAANEYERDFLVNLLCNWSDVSSDG